MFEILGYIFAVVLVASLLFHIIIYIINRNKDNPIIELSRSSSFWVVYDKEFAIIPTIKISCTGKYLEITIEWLRWAYYINYHFVHEDDE